MNYVQHPSNNGVFGAPSGWDQSAQRCSALPVTHHRVADCAAVTSHWRPTEVELAILLGGGTVALTVLGGGMPPVSLNVEG